MWQTMIAPLFNAAYVLLKYEPSETHKASLERVQKGTFKKFLMISKRTNSVLVNDMMRKNLRDLAYATVESCRLQWEQRKAFQCINAQLPRLAMDNGLKGVPNSWCELVNTMVKPCPSCRRSGIVTNRWHLLVKHKIRLPHVNYIWKKEILPIVQGVNQNLEPVDSIKKRQIIREAVKPLIQGHLQNYHNAWGQLLISNKAC